MLASLTMTQLSGIEDVLYSIKDARIVPFSSPEQRSQNYGSLYFSEKEDLIMILLEPSVFLEFIRVC